MSRREIPAVAKELLAAKRRIENPENWCTRSYFREGRRCGLGALGWLPASAAEHEKDQTYFCGCGVRAKPCSA